MANVSPAQIQERLDGIDYPASRQDLINHAGKHSKKGDKNEEVMNILKQIPDKEYHSPVDVSKEVGKIE